VVASPPSKRIASVRP